MWSNVSSFDRRWSRSERNVQIVKRLSHWLPYLHSNFATFSRVYWRIFSLQGQVFFKSILIQAGAGFKVQQLEAFVYPLTYCLEKGARRTSMSTRTTNMSIMRSIRAQQGSRQLIHTTDNDHAKFYTTMVHVEETNWTGFVQWVVTHYYLILLIPVIWNDIKFMRQSIHVDNYGLPHVQV